jgi:hypothetical protein
MVFLPLTILALYVNKLMARLSRLYRQLFTAPKGPDIRLGPLQACLAYDSDSERTAVAPTAPTPPPQQGPTTGTVSPTMGGSVDLASDEEMAYTASAAAAAVYAPLFGALLVSH